MNRRSGNFGYVLAALATLAAVSAAALPSVSAESQSTVARIDKQLFCYNGFIYNSDGKKLLDKSFPGCPKMISGSLFCYNGFVHNSDGQRLTKKSTPACQGMIGITTE